MDLAFVLFALVFVALASALKMSAHRIPADDSYATWRATDPGTGAKIPASGPGAMSSVALVIGSGAETNTLPDPDRPGLQLSLTVYSRNGGTRAVTASTKINTTGNTVITFGAVDHSVMLQSVPYAGNTNKARWNVIYNDGPTLS